MKKAYVITYFYTGAESRLKQVVEVIDSLGKKTAVQQTAKSYTVILFPSGENDDAVSIRNKISYHLNPFSENVSVARLVVSDYAETNGLHCAEEIEEYSNEEGEVPRNFSRFASRHEAYIAYQMEKPKWVYPDGIGVAIAVDFNDWCWLPIKKDGIYERNGKYDKYLNN